MPRLIDPSYDVNPKMIVLARESRALTQVELAEQLGVTQGKVSKIEAGTSPISADLLRRLSETLRYPEHFFTQTDLVYGPGVGEMFHRRRQDVPARTLARLHAQMNVRRMHIERLLRSVDVDCRIGSLDLKDYNDDPVEAARAVRVGWLLPPGPIQDLCITIENRGGIIVPCEFGMARVDAIGQWPPRLPPLFFVNLATPKDRLRFTLAHELAHVVLHDMPSADAEVEADRFAAEFLMPANDIAASLSDLSIQKLAAMKAYWRVSMNALLKRAQDLERITKSQSDRLWRQMGQAGYRTHEPLELEIGGEEPRLLRELIAAHTETLDYTVEELAKLLALLPDEIGETYLGRPPSLRIVG